MISGHFITPVQSNAIKYNNSAIDLVLSLDNSVLVDIVRNVYMNFYVHDRDHS